MSAISDRAIADLDAALAEAGQFVTLRRVVSAGAAFANLDVRCRASVRTYRLREEQIVAGVNQAVLLVTLSPAEIAAAQWPGGSIPNQAVDPSIIRRNDKIVIDGRQRNIDAVVPISIDDEIVRYDLQVLG